MSEPQRDDIQDPRPIGQERAANRSGGARTLDDRGGFRDTAPNPHDEHGAGQTAARATGAMAGMFFPVVIIAIVAVIVILWFVL